MGAGKRNFKSMALTVLLAFVALAGATSVGAFSEIRLRQHFQGVILQTMTPPPGKSFDTSVSVPKQGLRGYGAPSTDLSLARRIVPADSADCWIMAASS